jgi:hypothetical protein
LGLGFREENGKPFNKIFAIFIILEYLPPFYPSDHDVMREPGVFNRADRGMNAKYFQQYMM